MIEWGPASGDVGRWIPDTCTCKKRAILENEKTIVALGKNVWQVKEQLFVL